MKGIHPNSVYRIILAALGLSAGIAGCRGQSGSVANPFLAPDRVPPPATRAIMPGQAQPYYPGDPLPVMQSQASPTTESNGLTWGASGTTSPMESAAEPTPTLAAERMVAIPADNDALRFEITPPVEETPITPIAPPSIVAAAPDVQGQGVMQASYSEPVLTPMEPAPSPWRSPQIVEPTLPPPPVIQPIIAQPTIATPIAAAPDHMDVQLRAVPSPPPRIRMPGDVVPPTATADGFRPRSSMR